MVFSLDGWKSNEFMSFSLSMGLFSNHLRFKSSEDCMNLFFQGWSLVSIFTINGKDGAEDFDLIGEDKGTITWEICVSEEHTHEFHGLDTFDPNDEKYNVIF